MAPLIGSSFDGYTLIRKIGEGGFGEVWLSKSDATCAWKALKWISKTSGRHLEQELLALGRYSNAVSGVRSRHLVPIEHVRLLDGALIYVMPLADGFDGLTPEDSNWTPITLRGVMDRHVSRGTWFGLDEVKKVITGVLHGASLIAEAGMQHRDIKPENILFIDGDAALADFGLVAEDATMVSMRGTPWHAAPSWYLESGGNADQWGCAVLLYQLLTGNAPDKMGKSKYLRPHPSLGDLRGDTLDEWRCLQKLIFRATSESTRERFQSAKTFCKAIESDSRQGRAKLYTRSFALPLMGMTFVFLVGAYWMFQRHNPTPITDKNNPLVTTIPLQTPSPHSKPTPRPEWMDHPKLIYSASEVKMLNRFLAENNQAAIKKLNVDNGARYQELIKRLPPGADFSWVTEKMRFPDKE
jgi:serine/threonine protein kinase